MSIRRVKDMLDRIRAIQQGRFSPKKGGLRGFWWCSGQVLFDP